MLEVIEVFEDDLDFNCAEFLGDREVNGNDIGESGKSPESLLLSLRLLPAELLL